MNYGSICSGVEAASLAWGPLGWKALFFAEVEPFPSAVLCERYDATPPLRPLDPADAANEKERKLRESWAKQIAELPKKGTVPNLGDFTKIVKGDYDGKIDLLVGGTPCQDLSIAGKRLGFEGRRSVLALDFVQLCFESGTRWIVWENVPATLSSHNGADFGRLLSLFAGWDVPVPPDGWRKCGIVTNAPGCFGLAWRILDAQFTRVEQFPWAIPQRRKRLFLIGYLNNWKHSAAVLFNGEMCGGHTPPRRTKGQRTASGIEIGSDSAKWWDGGENAGTLTRTSDQQFMPDKGRMQCVVEKSSDKTDCIDIRKIHIQEEEIAPALVSTDFKGGKAISFYPQRNPSEECSNTLTNAGAPGHQTAICQEECPTIDASYPGKMNNQDVGKLVCFQQNTRDELRLMNGDGEIAGALCAELGTKQQNYLCFENHAQDARVRQADVAQTISARMGTGGNNLPLVMGKETPKESAEKASVFAFDSLASNSMKSSNPKSGCREIDVSKTLDTTNPEPSKNQGGMAVVEPNDAIGFIKNDAGGEQQGFWKEVFPTMRTQITPAVAKKECFNVSFCDANGVRKDRKNGGLYVTEAKASKTVTAGGPNTETVIIDPFEMPIALDGDKMGKAERAGGSGLGVSEEGVMYTQTTTDIHGVAYNECIPLDLRNARRTTDGGQGVGIGKDGDPMHTVTAAITPGIGWQATVRRLLPVECERLMGFPDNHTRIPWRGKSANECPDAPRYKACGNSMCVNVMMWLGQRIQEVENSLASREATAPTQRNSDKDDGR